MRRCIVRKGSARVVRVLGSVGFWGGLSLLLMAVGACQSTTPSTLLEDRVRLPVPAAATTQPAVASDDDGGAVRVSARTLISMAFNQQPDIKSSYQAFKAEEARYDFFYASNDALTPRLSSANTLAESREMDDDLGRRAGSKDRRHDIELGIDKQFFDTTALSIAGGMENSTIDGDFGNQPYVAATVRYPLWGSREKLERASEDIFRRNELNDAQLAYIEQVRHRLQRALMKFHEVVELRGRLASAQDWRRDLEELAARLETIGDRDVTADRRRIEAEMARVTAEVRNISGRYEVDLARLKYVCGLPYETEVEVDEQPFNPFRDASHDELRRISIATDPEIATLRNAMRNAEVQLDLARRGKWDVVLLMEGKGGMRGRGAKAGETEWSVSTGLDISAVDARVTSSLQRQARASISRFRQAIAARESLIYVDTLEPLVRIDTLSASRDELLGNLERFQADYRAGLEAYAAGELNIDDLLKRRETIFEQEEEIAELTFIVGANVAELCSATGKFFELLDTTIE